MAVVELDNFTLRVTCSCRDLSHHLDICIEEPNDWNFIEINTQEHAAFHWYGWEKVRAMWRLLWNKPICCGGISVTRKDLEDIAKFIERNV